MALTLVRGCTAPDEVRDGEPGRLGGDTRETPAARAVRRARTGDRDALEFLYARYADDAYGCVRSIIDDRDEAEDVTRHVFVKLIRMIGSYEEHEGPFSAWMLRLARNVALDHVHFDA
jgi:DNA-directed RNA polymerase specialized sigma24 family protein